jgi:MFS family permease
MGGVQAVLSLALISGPLVAGAAFDELGVPAPYFIGAALAALAVPAVALSGRKEPVTLVADPGVAVPGPRGFPTGGESERRQS